MNISLGILFTAVGLFLFLWYRTVVALPEATRPAGVRRRPFKWGIPVLSACFFLTGIFLLAREGIWPALGGLAGSVTLAFIQIKYDRYTAAMRIIVDQYRKIGARQPNMEELELLYLTAKWRYPDWSHDRLLELVAGKDIESLILLMLLNENKINPITDWELYRSLREKAAAVVGKQD
jgi:hypothetical protein